MTTVNQLRIYTIRDGLMDEWLEFFSSTLIRLHNEAGVPVVFASRNVDHPDEFIWMRQFSSADAVEEEEDVFFSLPERVALGDVRGKYVAKFEIRVVEPLALNN